MNMKNLKVILFALSISIFASCDDAIDIRQPSELTPEDTFETVEDLQLGLNAVYGSVGYENTILFTSIFTDEIAIGVSNGGQGQSDGALAFRLPADSGDASSIWLSNYYMINLANRLIEGSEFVTVEPGSDEEAQKNHILAQARALRAFGHFQLLTYFSTDLKNDGALGVIKMDFVPEITARLPRNTNGEIFELINGDLDFADANIIDVTLTDREYIGKNFILAFRARMAAYRGQYDAAKTYVDALDQLYGLTNKANYPRIWEDFETGSAGGTSTNLNGVAGSEVIFKLGRINNSQTGNFYGFWSSVNSSVTGSPFFEVDRALFNLVNYTQDVRRFVLTDDTALILEDYDDPSVSDQQYKEGDVLPVGKYPGSEDLNLLNDVKVFRFSEMVLIRAEYYANAGDLAGVLAELNKIRDARNGSNQRRIPATEISNTTQAWAAIMDERRAELAFEGHRYIDVKRLGTLAGKGLQRDPRDCAFNGFCTLPATDYRFTMPIPQSESAANNTIVQNPGY